MHNHFDSHLGVEVLLRSYRPKTVLELGANRGENTTNLLKLSEELDYKLTVVSPEYPYWTEMSDTDQLHIRRGRFEHFNLNWIYGVSYIELATMEDESIDFCILDTDHNYWTLEKELLELKRVMSDGGIVAIHDTEEFSNKNGVQELGYFKTIDSIGSYTISGTTVSMSDAKVSGIGIEYPMEEILSEKRPYPQAIRDVVPEWTIVKETKESNGAVALLKVV
mgnify:FL=1